MMGGYESDTIELNEIQFEFIDESCLKFQLQKILVHMAYPN